jgi:hypothetical protein
MTEQLSLFNLPTPSMPKLNITECAVRWVNRETAAMVAKELHYAHRVPRSMCIRVGLFIDDVLAGCLTYGMPTGANIRDAVCGEQYEDTVLELNRLFIHDWVGPNAESWFISQSWQFVNRPAILIAYADPNVGHLGYIYQATNWLYTGRSWNSYEYEMADGRTIKTRRHIDRKGEIVSQRIVPGKHRYVYFLGSKKQRKELRAALRWPVLPYPKGGEE